MAKVLLVEDDNNLREIYQARLAAEGYDISAAQDGEEALVVAKQVKPDLVISDVMMPKISGFEMLDILRNTAGLENVKVIMLTALGQTEDRSRADSLGADKYLVKSQVTLEDIVKTAQELLGGETSPASVAPAAAETPIATPAAEPVQPEPMAVAPAPEPVAEAPASEVPAPEVSPSAAPVDAPLPTPVEPASPAPAVVPVPEPVAADTPLPTPEPVQPTETPTEAPAVTPEPAAEMPAPAEPVATPEVTTPATPAPEVTEPSEAPAPTPETASNSDDKLLAEAVDQLGGSTPDATSAPTSPAQVEAEAANTGMAVTGKKVIQPIQSEPKPSINELLAKEEAANGGAPASNIVTPESPAPTADAPAHQPGESFTPQTPPAGDPSQQKNDGFDPHSVAL